MKKLLLYLSLLLLTGSFVLAQEGSNPTISLPNITAEGNTTVTIPVTVSNFTNIGAFSINIKFSPSVLTFDTTDWDSQITGAIVGSKPGEVSLQWDGIPAVNITNGLLVNLIFQFKAGSCPMTFSNVCDVSDISGNSLSVVYNNGGITEKKLQYTLTINGTGSGSGEVKVNNATKNLPYSDKFDEGTIVNVEAAASNGSSFTSWGGDLTGTANPASITMTSDKNVTVGFNLDPVKYTLKVNKTGSGSGKIKIGNESDFRTLPYEGTYDEGTDVTITAQADEGSNFSAWGGDGSGTNNQITVHMNSGKTLNAGFDLKPPTTQYTLTIYGTGTGTGKIKVNNATKDLPYSDTFDEGTIVNLEAVASNGSNFTGWGGDLTGITNPTTITMSSNKTVTAGFDLIITKYTLSITGTGTGSGKVKVNNATKDLPFSDTYDKGTIVNIEAAAANGSTFTGWGGDLTGTTNPTTITMGSNKTVTAGFDLNIPKYTLTITGTGIGSGKVKVNNATKDLPYSDTFDEGTVVNLEAVAANGSNFTGWGGALSGKTNPTSITMSSDKAVTAVFDLIIPKYTLSINASGTSSGKVKVNNATKDLPYSDTFAEGVVVNLEAVAANGTSFTGWGGDLTGTTNPTTITMNSNKSVTAGFDLIVPKHTMSITGTGTGSGKVKVNHATKDLPYSDTFDEGSIVNVEAVPANGSSFTGWGGDLSGTTNPTTITMSSNKTVTAGFDLNAVPRQFTLIIKNDCSGSGVVKVNGTIEKLPYENVFNVGTEVTIKAIAGEGSIFGGWDGRLCNESNPITITMNSDVTLYACFKMNMRTLTITKKGTGTGQVRVNGELNTLPFEGQFDCDEIVTLQAVPCEGSSFVAWGGDLSGTCSNPATIKMTLDREVTVEFNSAPCAPVLISPVGQCALVIINPVLKWQASGNASSYNVQVSTDICFKSLVLDETVTTTCRQIGPLNYNTCYYWRVRAGNCAGMGKFSDAAVFKTEKQPVKAPCNLLAKAEVGKVRLFWADSSDNESGFIVFRKEGDLKSESTYDPLGKVDRNNTVFVDSTIKVNVTYTYKVSAFTADSVESYSNEFTITNTLLTVEEGSLIPSDYKLYQNYPNPFNPSTVIRYFLKNDSHVKLTVFNSLGKEVSVLVNEFRQSGMNSVTFNASNVSAGVYLYRIETLEEGSGKRYMDVKKLVLMK